MNDIKFLDILGAQDNIKEKLRQWRNSERVSSFMLNQHAITKEEHLKWIEGLRSDRCRKNWVIFINAIPIGSIYLEKINREKLTSEWGFYIGDNDYTGKGLAKQILFKFLEVFFDQMEFKALFTNVLPYNTKAMNLYRKFGFKEINRRYLGKDNRVIFLKFTREDWLDKKCELRNEYCNKNTR